MNQYLVKIKNSRNLTELIRYGVFGVATTVLNIATYQLLSFIFDYRVSNLIAIIFSKAFAYVTNKLFVFRSRCSNKRELLLEAGRYLMARGATGLFDYFGLIFAVEMLHCNKIWSKYVIQFIVIVLNYMLGKHTVFKNVTSKENEK